MMLDWFCQHYPDCPPLAHLMRERFPWRWFRIHSLPESKRYPESDFDEGIVLSRHNRIATDILGENAECVLCVTQYGTAPLDFPYHLPEYPFIPVYRFFEEDDAEPWVSWGTTTHWAHHEYNQLILAIANEDECNTLFISPLSGGIYAPYDGGADLFHVDPKQVNELKDRYREWASSHPECL